MNSAFKAAWKPHGVYQPSGDDDWLEARRNLVTASEISTICGIWGDERIRELVIEKLTGERSFKGNLKTRAGSALEPFIWDEIQAGRVDDLDVSLEHTHWNDGNRLHFGADRSHGCTPDIIETSGSALACSVWNMKVTGYYAKNLPTFYMRMQVNWEMHVTGALHGGIVAFNIAARPEAFLSAFPVERDSALINRMVNAADAWLAALSGGYSADEMVAEMQAFAIEQPTPVKAKKGKADEPSDF